MNKNYIDDKFIHLERDIDKLRSKSRMYISFSNELAALAIVSEILWNCVDEIKNPRSPGDKIEIIYDERNDTITISDNGRGIPTDKLELILTTLNSGSNIDSGDKNNLEIDTLGRNGVGTLAMVALGERTEVTSYRGGTENKIKKLIFEEGNKIHEEESECSPDIHGLKVSYKPSKILGKRTRIIWDQVHDILINLQFLNRNKIKMLSIHYNKNGNMTKEDYKTQAFENILKYKNSVGSLLTNRIKINIEDKNIIEEIGGKKYKRFMNMDIAFVYTSSSTPYIDSFCNINNTIDNGSHLDGAIEGLCRYFQGVTKNSLSEREKLDIKWDDVKNGLSIVVSLHTSMEEIFTSQTKHKVSNEDLEKLIKDKTIEALQSYFKTNNNQLKEFINTIKINAKVRHEGDKARNAVVKESISNWSAYKMTNYDPCTAKTKEYRELYIIEGNSAKGSLKLARDPKFQALFAIRGVSANAFKLDLNGILANKEFNDLIKIMGCNVGNKFDLSKLQFNKIIIASDADIDGLFIRSLLMSFFYKVFPEIIEDNKLYIAEPPLYRVDDKKNPFIVDKDDYINRYIKNVMKEYTINFANEELLDKEKLYEFLSDTSSYVEDIELLSKHYNINERLLELILEEIASE